jgi:hypothetical protein
LAHLGGASNQFCSFNYFKMQRDYCKTLNTSNLVVI